MRTENKKLKRKKRNHYIKIMSLFLAVFIIVSGAYAVIALSNAHNMLYIEKQEEAARLHYEAFQSKSDTLNYTINNNYNNKSVEIEVLKDGIVIAKTDNILSVNFKDKDTGDVGEGTINFYNFKDTLTSSQYVEIINYLEETPDADESELNGNLRYELVCREFYFDDEQIIPKRVEIVITNDINTWYAQDEKVKSFKLNVDKTKLNNTGVYKSGDMYKNVIDRDFVLDKYRNKGLFEQVEKIENGKEPVSNGSSEIKVSPFEFIFFQFDTVGRIYYSFDSPYNTSDEGELYEIKYASSYNILDVCLLNILFASIIIFLFFLIVGYLITRLSWRSIATEIEQEKIRLDMTKAMAHDLKTPLFIISGFAENLREDESFEKREHYTDVILEQSRHMNNLIHSMLDYSKFESDDFELKKSEFSLLALVLEAVEKYHDDRIEKSVYGDISVFADRNLLTTVVNNFIDNALKYGSKKNPIEIEIKENRLSVSNSLEKEITDEQIEKMWKPYSKLDSSRVSTGNGLGLAISKRILELHNFKYGAKTNKDQITFYIEF